MSTQPFFRRTTLALLASMSLAQAQMPGGATPTVLVAPVSTGFDSIERRSIGHTEAIRTVDVQTAVQGYLAKINVENGAYVKKGDILFVIDTTRYQAELDQAKATIAELHVRIDYTKKHLKRLHELVEKQATSKQEEEDYVHQLESLQANMAEAEAMLTLAEKNLTDCTIRATIAGRVGRIQNAVGNYVDSGAQLATIKQMDPIYVKFPLSQNDVKGVFHGHKEIKNVTDITLRTPTGFVLPTQGKIAIVDSQLNEDTDSYTLWAEFANREGALTPGGIGEVSVRLNTRQAVKIIPLTGVRYDASGAYVFTVEDDKIARHNITVGNVQGSSQTVYDGVDEGALVVIDGAHKIRVGSTVKSMMAPAPSSEEESKPSLNDTLPPVPVSIVTAQRIADPSVLKSHGARVEEVRQVDIKAKVDGTLEHIGFTEGRPVKAGEVLFQIDSTRYAATVKAQKAKIQQIDVQIKDAKAKWERQQYLYQRRATSLNDVDTAQLTYDTLIIQKQAAEARLIIAEDDLARCTIKAPINGIIGRIHYTVGSYIKGDNELATLIQVRPMYVRFSLSETDILCFYGSTKEMQEQAEISLIDATGKKYEGTGHIEFVDNTIQTGTGTQNCWAVFGNSKGLLKAGSVVSIKLRRKPEFQQLAIPATAVQLDSQGCYVYLLRDGRAIKTRIISGAINEAGLMAVYKGITDKDQVINSNFSTLVHQAKVEASAQ